MPLIILTVIVQGCFIFHVFKTGRPYWWAYVILGFPVLGCVVYYFVEVFPNSREHRAANRAARGLERWGRMPTPPTGDPACDVAYARGRVESFRHGGLWLARELAYLGRPWGFELADVRAPVALWWGRGDSVCPPSIGEAFAARLPQAELHLVEGTHQLLFVRWRDILADVSR